MLKEVLSIDKESLCWLSGLLEGEGSFMKGPPSNINKPIVCMTTTDLDVAQKVSNLLGISVQKIKSRKAHWKQAYHVRVSGKRAVCLMNLIYDYMGLRRKDQIKIALACYTNDYKDFYSRRENIKKDLMSKNFTHEQLGKKYGVDRSTISHFKRKYIS